MKISTQHQRAFTLVELLVVIAVLVLLVAIQFPVLAGTKAKVEVINCSDNLKRISVAFTTWAASRADRMPMNVAQASGGAREAVGVIAPVGNTFAVNMGNPAPIKGVFGMFAVMSNELTTPKILYCPSENAQSSGSAASIGPQGVIFGPSTASVDGFKSDLNASYFVGVDAQFSSPGMLLVGDHNLGFGANQAIKMPSFISAGTNVAWPSTSIGWQNNNHFKQGNACLIDGSVQSLSTAQFRITLNKTGDFGRSPGVFALASGSFGSGYNRLQFP